MRRLAVPAPAGLPRQADVAARLARELPGALAAAGAPAPAIDRDGGRGRGRRAGPTDQALMVNRDLPYRNVLAGRREPWLAIDPKAIAGEPALGLAQLLWSRLDGWAGEPGCDGSSTGWSRS